MDILIDLVDWVPDTLWDTVLVMVVVYGCAAAMVWEVLLLLDRRNHVR